MRVVALAGGVGSGRFLSGLVRVMDPADLTLIANVGDDEEVRGLHISPDIDTVLYHLASSTDWARGWGLGDDTFIAQERFRKLVAAVGDVGVDLQEWFGLGDQDLATHMLRTRLLDVGRTLGEATDVVRRALGVACRIIPATDERVRTRIRTADGTDLDFQSYFVKHHQRDEIVGVTYEGASDAPPAPGVLDALEAADLVIVPPSNPILTIGPILAIRSIAEAIENATVPRVGVSPIVGGKAIKGPADRVLGSLGHEASSIGVHLFYERLLDVLVVDHADADLTPPDTLPRWVRTNTVMTGPEDAAVLAKAVLDLAC